MIVVLEDRAAVSIGMSMELVIARPSSSSGSTVHRPIVGIELCRIARAVLHVNAAGHILIMLMSLTILLVLVRRMGSTP